MYREAASSRDAVSVRRGKTKGALRRIGAACWTVAVTVAAEEWALRQREQFLSDSGDFPR